MNSIHLRHRCGWPSCAKLVPLDMWGCRAHWYALPQPLRQWIGRAYREGVRTDTHPTRSYVKAHRAALEWIAASEEGRPLPRMYGPTFVAYSATTEEKEGSEDDARRDLP